MEAQCLLDGECGLQAWGGARRGEGSETALFLRTLQGWAGKDSLGDGWRQAAWGPRGSAIAQPFCVSVSPSKNESA